jgi:hypothetical protein
MAGTNRKIGKPGHFRNRLVRYLLGGIGLAG